MIISYQVLLKEAKLPNSTLKPIDYRYLILTHSNTNQELSLSLSFTFFFFFC